MVDVELDVSTLTLKGESMAHDKFINMCLAQVRMRTFRPMRQGQSEPSGCFRAVTRRDERPCPACMVTLR
jgi:hypothetical protein